MTLPWTPGLDALAVSVHATAVEKKWWPKGRSRGEVFALFHSEISEALEAYRLKGPKKCWSYRLRDKDEGVLVDVADLMIRALDAAGAWGVTSVEGAISHHERAYRSHRGALEPYRGDVPAGLNYLHDVVSGVHQKQAQPSAGVAHIVMAAVAFAESHDKGDALWVALKKKASTNRHRPVRHGGRHA